MSTIRGRSIIAIAVVTTMLASGVAFAYPTSFTGVGLATGSASQYNAEMDGDWVVYQISTPLVPGSHTSLSLRNLHNNSSVAIGAGDDYNQSNPDVSNGVVVYEDDSSVDHDIVKYDALASRTTTIAASAAEETMPRISGNLIAWYNATDGRVHYVDSHTSGIVPDSSNVTYLDVDRGRIFWSDALVTQNVYVFEPGIDTSSRTVYTAPSGDDIESLSAYGDYGAITRDHAGTLYAERFGTESVSSWAQSNASAPSLFHESRAYQTAAYDVRWGATDYMGSMGVGTSTDDEMAPSIFGNSVVYTRTVSILNNDIYIATSTPNVDRTYGTDRYKTAIEVSKAYFDSANDVVLCTGENFPDALAAVPFARVLGGPLLLCRRTSISAETLAEIERLGARNIHIVGGPAAVDWTVSQQLETAGYSVYRDWGDDRYETSAAIARAMNDYLQPGHKITGAFFANGSNFPDALALGPVASGAMWPILLVRKDSIPDSVSQVIDDFNMDDGGAVAGGTNVVSEYVRNRIITEMLQAPNVERWDGIDRYSTAVEVVQGGLDHHWIDLDTLGIATGTNFPDALGGGAAMGHYGSPILLVQPTAVPAGVSGFMTGIKHKVGRIDIFGSTSVVSDGVKGALTSALP